MSFAKIAEGRAVKKIVEYVRGMAARAAALEAIGEPEFTPSEALNEAAARIEARAWSDKKPARKKKDGKKKT